MGQFGLGVWLALTAAGAEEAKPVAIVTSAEVKATANTWPSWRGDAAQTGRSPSALGELVVRWQVSVGEAVLSSAVVDEQRVYLGVKSGAILALDRQTGAELWKVMSKGSVEAPPLRLGNLLIVGSRDGVMRALEASTGREVWTHEAKAEITAPAVPVPGPPGGAPGVVYGAYDGKIYQLDAATGAVRWTYSTGSYIYGSAARRDGELLIGGCDGFVHRISCADGSRLAAIEVGQYVGASPAWVGDAAWVGHFGNAFVALDTAQSKVSWTFEDRSFPFLSSAAVTDELVIFGGRDRVVRAVERATGELWWLAPTRGKVDSSPVVVGDKVVFGAHDGRVYVVTLADGAELWSFDAASPISASPAVAGGWVYLGTEGGTVYGFGPPVVKEKKGRGGKG